MTILSTDNRRSYSGDGSTTVFSFPVRFLEDADVKVALRVNDVESEPVLNTDYTVSGAGNPAGGSVTFTVAPVSGATVVIYNDPALTQSVDYRDDDEFPAETHERALDKLTLIVQRLGARLARTLQYDETAPTILTASEVLTRVDDAETARDEAQTAATQTAADLVETAADVIAAEAAKVAAESARDTTLGYRDSAGAHKDDAEVAQTATEAARDLADADAAATAADRVQTGLDRVATAADRVATNADAVQTAADRVQTGLDKTAAETAKTAAETARDEAQAAAPPFPITQVTGLQGELDGKYSASNPPPVPDILPSGWVGWFASSTAPTGFLKANGAAVSRTTYAALFAVIGTTFGAGDGSTTFNLPDLRGEFIRGWDDGAGVDSGRVFGSAQADAFKSHDHSITTRQSSTSISSLHVGNGNSPNSPGSVNTSPEGGDETRPRNIALLACIKF